MCGIFGIFSKKEINSKKAQEGFSKIVHRGKDAVGKIVASDKILFHCLHAVVGKVQQPLASTTAHFMTNCEIYNWKELNKKYGFSARNDAELFFFLLEKKSIAALDELDGVYAFFYQKGDDVYLGRDILGEKPLCYVFNENLFAFASEAKALTGYGTVQHLVPTQILQYNTKNHTLKIRNRTFFDLPKENTAKKEIIINELETKLLNAVQKRIIDLDSFGILFSGGIDSTLLAFLCKKLGKQFTCYTAAFADGNTRDAPDLLQAQEVASLFHFPLKVIQVHQKETEQIIKEVVRIIETTDVVKVGIALPFYLCAKQAAADGHKVLFSGLGSEELFAGYQRHLDVLKRNGNPHEINAECLRGLSRMWERDLYRDDLVAMAHTVELRLPFLDHDLIRFALSIPATYKITEQQSSIQKMKASTKRSKSIGNNMETDKGVAPSGERQLSKKNVEILKVLALRSEFLDGAEQQNKIILRELAMHLGIPHKIAQRKKIAAQYGSNFDKALEKLAKKAGCKTKKEYLVQLITYIL